MLCPKETFSAIRASENEVVVGCEGVSNATHPESGDRRSACRGLASERLGALGADSSWRAAGSGGQLEPHTRGQRSCQSFGGTPAEPLCSPCTQAASTRTPPLHHLATAPPTLPSSGLAGAVRTLSPSHLTPASFTRAHTHTHTHASAHAHRHRVALLPSDAGTHVVCEASHTQTHPPETEQPLQSVSANWQRGLRQANRRGSRWTSSPSLIRHQTAWRASQYPTPDVAEYTRMTRNRRSL
eukprot:GHVU01170275.1.p1 GENE.GHVU01170275.1~~GHVU01170275.1.p1  ORF type:complete len:241 (+),score=0.29 GHVU01170275.1:122-844(+)